MTQLFLVYAQTHAMRGKAAGEYPVVAVPTEKEAQQYVAKLNELVDKLEYEEDLALWTPAQKEAAHHLGHLDPSFIWGETDYYGVVSIRTMHLGGCREYIHHIESAATLLDKAPEPVPVVKDRNRTRAMQV